MKNLLKYCLLFSCCLNLDTCLYGQGTTTAEYYQYQRDQAFKKYMENVSSKGMASPANTKFDYAIDKKAVQDMVDLWERRAGKKTAAETEAERAALRQKWAKEYHESLAYDAFSDNRELTYQKMRNFYADLYQSVGFSLPESNRLASSRIFEKRETYNDSYATLVFVDNPVADLAFSAKKTFEELKHTAGFEEVLPLIYDFSITGYSAVKALEFLEMRFPDKKAIVNSLKPLYGISYWQYKDEKFELPSATRPGKKDFYFRHKVEGSELSAEMAAYVYEWMEENPEGLVSLLENGNKYSHYNIIDHAFKNKNWQQYARFTLNFAMHGETNLAKKGKIMEDYRQYGFSRIYRMEEEERAGYEKSKYFTWPDFEAVSNRYQISGVKAMELLGLAGSRYNTELYAQFGPRFPWFDKLYVDEIKRSADMGESDAKYMHAIHLLTNAKKMEWQKGYEQLLKLLEEGYADAFYLDREYDLKKTLGFSKRNIEDFQEAKRKYSIKQ